MLGDCGSAGQLCLTVSPPRPVVCLQVASVEDMYGRANPKPVLPSYDAEDLRAMKAVEEREALAERTNVTGPCGEETDSQEALLVCSALRSHRLVPVRAPVVVAGGAGAPGHRGRALQVAPEPGSYTRLGGCHAAS